MVKKWWKTVVDVFHVYQSYKVPEFNNNLQENHLYMKVYAYLNSLSSMEDSDFTNLFTGKKSNEIILRLYQNQIVGDEFLAVPPINGEFSVLICSIYTRVTEELEQRNTELKLFMNVDDDMKRKKNGRTRWRSIPFNHPSTENNTTVVLAASGNGATSCTDLPAPENQASSRRWRSFSTTSSPTRALKHLISALQIDGDRRGARRRLILESGSRRSTAEDGGAVSGPLCGGGGSSPAVKELRKLYGLLRIKSSRKSESLDVARENRDW
ncbi:unnamed protein product [Brassica rapa]|uniref:AAA-type ATPase N-terminal domain-containing protein n=1 Tax=Brassica campestris TaxID=3711 RepID=A0A8D9MGJ6_BRACM|nr:unnamed protein product [Brassica rapa]